MKFFQDTDCDYLIPSEGSASNSVPAISLDKANAILEKRSKVVYGQVKNIDGGMSKKEYFCATQIPNCGETHKGLLICVEPLEVDSAEKVLEDLANWEEWQHVRERGKPSLLEIQERARKLTQNKGGG